MPRKLNKAMLSSDNTKWGTPRDFFKWADASFEFTLDVCAEKHTAKCRRYFTEDDDGLARSWENETAWMNPPYGDQLPRWLDKARLEATHSNAAVACLVPSRTDASWFRDVVDMVGVGRLRASYYEPRSRVFWLRYVGLRVGVYHHGHRLKFEGAPGDSAPFPSSLLLLIPNGRKFKPRLFICDRPPLLLGMPM